MVQKGLVNTIKNVATDIDSRISTGRLDTWSTRVLKTSNTSANKVIIQAGANSGLKSGDELAVYHINHEWEGEPCNSRYLGWSFASDVPVATLKVTDNIKLNPNFSTVEIIDPHSTQSSIHPGDYVTVHKLVPGINNTLRSPLARSIHIGTTDAGKFLIENTEIDLASYVKLLIKPSILDSSLQGKYYIH